MNTEQLEDDSEKTLGYQLPSAVKIKNKRPSSKQITAEQIVQEAQALQTETEFKPPRQIISDPYELDEYRLAKRKEFEDLVRRMRWNAKIWLKYSKWEEQQKDFRRARSVYERSIDVDYRNSQTWLRYAEMEMRNRFLNHARNVWDRAVNLLPRVNQLWYKYAFMEEMLGNVTEVRKVFERWISWDPNYQGWIIYIKFELRYGKVEKARNIYKKFIFKHPKINNWIKYAKF
jgi:crooked neck